MYNALSQPFSAENTVIAGLYHLILHEHGQLWALQDKKENNYPLQAGELPRAMVSKHLAGNETIAARLLQQTTNTAKAGCIDLDIPRDAGTLPEAITLAQQLAAVAQAHGCTAHLEFSGRRGVHVWLFSDRPLPGSTWQAALRALSAEAGFTAKEIFPCAPTCSQEQKSIKLPFGVHQLSGQRAGFLGPVVQWDGDQLVLPDQAELLPQLQQTPAQQIAALAQAAPVVAAKGSSSTQNPEFIKHFPNSHPGCIQRLLDQGCPVELEYNGGNTTLARYALARGLSQEDAIALAEAMAQATPDSHPTSKGPAERVANFRSVFASASRNPDSYSWGCSYALSGAKLKHKHSLAARGCPANRCPSWPKEWQQGQGQDTAAKKGLHYQLWAAIATVAEAGQELRPSTLLQALEGQNLDAFPPDYQAALAWADTDADHATEREAFAYLLQNPTAVDEALALDLAAAGFVCDPPGFTTWASYLDSLLALSPPLLPQTFTAHLKRIRDTGIRVLGSTQNTKAAEALADRTQAVDQTLDDLITYGNSLLRRASSDIEPMADQVPDLLAELFSRPQQAIATPSQWLNTALNGGWQPGKLYVLSAPPAAGKTTFSQWVGDHAAQAKVPVLVASYEMTREQLFTAGLARLAKLNSQQIEARAWTSPTLTATQQQTLITEIQQAALTYQADISPHLTILEAGPEHTAAKLKGAIAHIRGQLGLTDADPVLVVVDYLQLLFTGDDRLDSGQNETLRVSRIATALKQLARDSRAAVIAISDITKEAYQKALSSGSLDMSALRDSFKIAHAADTIMLLQTGVISREGGPVDQLDLAALNATAEKAAAIAQARNLYPLRAATKDSYARLSILKNRGGGLADPLFVYQKAVHRFTPIDLPVAAQASPDKDPGF